MTMDAMCHHLSRSTNNSNAPNALFSFTIFSILIRLETQNYVFDLDLNGYIYLNILYCTVI